jgi:hypothetical protein
MKKIVLFLTLILTIMGFSGKAQVATIFSENFEAGVLPAGWQNIDSDGDGNSWIPTSSIGYIDGHESGGAFMSWSKLNNAPLTPDNWLVTSEITLMGNCTLHFWRQVGGWPGGEHFGVFVSTTSATDLTSFSSVFEETAPQDNLWYERTVDLSDYAGQTVYIAFRHYNCSGKFAIILDDITITSSGVSSLITAVPSALQFLNIPTGTTSASQTVTVTGYGISDDITATTDAPFEISLDNLLYSDEVTMSSTDSILYVRYHPTIAGNNSSSLTLTDGSTSAEVTLTGSSVNCNNTLPYEQNFDNIPENGIPTCWTKINAYQGFPKVFPYNGHIALLFVSNSDAQLPCYAVLPPMPADLSELQLTFTHFREGHSSGTFSVGYITIPGDGNSFVPLWTTTAQQMGDNNSHQQLVSFGNIETEPGNQYQIAFKYENVDDWGWFLDDVIVSEIPACATPNNLTVSQVTSTTATVNWDGNTDYYNLYYKISNLSNWTEIADVAPDSTGYLIENLESGTQYSWYVAAVCDDTTFNSLETGTFATECATYTAPFTQNFDISNSLPLCWNRYTGLASTVFGGGALTPVTDGWRFNSANVFGNYHPTLNIYGTDTKHWLVTPPIDLGTMESPTLSFNLALTKYYTAAPILNPNAQADDKFMVIISTDSGATWNAANATVWSNDNNGDYVYNQIATTGEDITLSLAAYAGQTVTIAFYGESTIDANGDNDLHIDNVMVYNGTNCAKPTNLSVSGVTSSSITLAWTENGDAESWYIEYGPSGYTQGSPSGNVLFTETNPYTINGLDSIAYDFYVQANCIDEQSLWSQPITATPGTFSMGISRSDTLTTCGVTVYDNGGATGNYGNECNATLVLYPETPGSSIAVSGSYNTENEWDSLYIYDGAGTDGMILGGFSGIGTFATLAASNGPLTIQFISDEHNSRSGFELAVSCVSCTPPINLTVSDVTPTTATFNWKGQATNYKVEYKAEGEEEWTVVFITDTACTLTGLDPMTTYLVNVYTDCAGEYSPSVTTTFSTPMVAATLPYSTDFSDGSDQMWLLNNGDRPNRWKIGTVSGNDKALFITANGNTPGYGSDGSFFSVVTAEKLITVGDAATVTISFDTKLGGEDEFDYMKVFFAPADSSFPASNTNVDYAMNDYFRHAVDFIDYLQYTQCTFNFTFCMTNDSMVHVTVSMPNPIAEPDATSTAKLVFLWRNDNSNGEQPGAIIDNVSISIETLPCPAPTELRETGIIIGKSAGALSVEWTDNAGTSQWKLQYRLQGTEAWTTVVVNGSPHYDIFDGIVSGSTYELRVQAVCDNGVVSGWSNTLTMVAQGVGIDEHLSNIITLYPNPANNHVDIRVEGDVTVTSMEVHDVYGKSVIAEVNNDSSLPTRINVSGLANGMYFVRVTTDKGIVTKTFVKK